MMKELIQQRLEDIEQSENVKILYAVESGSRAWGFASPDSDFDVRFIYVRDTDFYLKLEPTRDVIEWQLDETLDINGWDLQKALRLLHNSNPTLFEWANSPIVYKTTEEWQKVNNLLNDHFITKTAAWHYLSMAESNYRTYLRLDNVRIKKYLYVIRPILACNWVLSNETPPPMMFLDLGKAELHPTLLPEIEHLLEIKGQSPEIGEMPKREILNRYIEERLSFLREQISLLPKAVKPKYDAINNAFIDILKGN